MFANFGISVEVISWMTVTTDDTSSRVVDAVFKSSVYTTLYINKKQNSLLIFVAF